MKSNCILCLLTAIVLVLSACTTTEQNKDNTVPASSTNTNPAVQPLPTPSNLSNKTMNEEVILRISIEEDSKLRPEIVGETNLPDKTELLVTVSGISTNFTGQDKALVQAGRFQAGPFGPPSGLKPGQYTVDIVMSTPSSQPDSVRAVLGQNGENLKGSLVTKGQLGVVVKVKQEFKLTPAGVVSGKTDMKAVQTALIEAREVLQALKSIEKQGRSMEALRNTNDLSKIRQCGNLMRERQKRAKEFIGRAEKLPKSYGIPLSVAARELSMCVTCSKNAIQNCNIVQSTLKDAEKAINKAK